MEANFDLQALSLVHARRRLKLCSGIRQECSKDGAKVLVDLGPDTTQCLRLLLIKIVDHLLNLALVVEDDVTLAQQILVLLLRLLEHDHGFLVDVLAELVLLGTKIVALRLVLLVAVGFKVEVGALLPEESLLLHDPRVLLLEPSHHHVRLLVVFLQLLDLVNDPLVLQLLLFSLLLVAGQFLCEAAQCRVEALQVIPHLVEFGPCCLVGLFFFLQPLRHLLHFSCQRLLPLASVLILALLGQHLVSDHLQLHLSLLRLFALLLQLIHVLLSRLLQLDHLLLVVLDAVLAAGVQVLDVLLELLDLLLQLLLLLRLVGDFFLELLHLALHLLDGLLGRVVLASADPIQDKRQLVLLALQLPV
mmetsp:Transcript_21807/g.34937  ORF Transcript_21807/g.34937 Transcript_21807/m.34937 type:complete len:361 (+) Transcript_21807:1673-2755(+)